MKKSDCIEILGGTPGLAAAAIGVSPQAVSDWPDVLPPRISDRVLAAWARKHVQSLPQAFRCGADASNADAQAPDQIQRQESPGAALLKSIPQAGTSL
ncbi:Cro/Cl family transcriptional regulator [Comamonas sp. CMM03]|uniref:Cro/Cl family transcriptional regulator n=1 Tax=Comamonas sp. CMM03 TaxID=2854781 RepID=UPI001C48F9B3|nr:Cro/Cl family transcriptional regulator [Comamonas sp. CMM03]MBV7418459.1 Cro/Cl family transcriptional regulator [Comamonas sp. CMM03]